MRVDTVLVKVASRCNINCTYCYVYNMGDDGWQDMPALMSLKSIDTLSLRLGELSIDQDRPFATVLHGGEPLMLGARRLDILLRKLRTALPPAYPICLQTNGILITSEILDTCAEHHVSISVSLDGPKAINDRFRLNKRGESTHDKVIAGIKLLSKHEKSASLFSGILCVVDPATEPSAVYSYFKGLNAPSMDFLYRDGNHTEMPFGKHSFGSTEYGEWMCGLLNAYLEDTDPPRIRFLDDIIKLILGGRGAKEGLGTEDYGIAIVDTDGTITKNDTLKSAFNGADRFASDWSIHSHRLAEIFGTDEFRTYHSLQRPTSETCMGCSDLPVCGGGMPLHRWKKDTGFDNPSVYCADQKLIINTVRDRLHREKLV